MEANYRFAGPETIETKIFGRLTAWQNWIFYRPNASGPTEPSAASAPDHGRIRPEAGLSHDLVPTTPRDPQQRRPARGPPPAARPGVLATELPGLVGATWARPCQTQDVYLRTADQRRPRRLGQLRPRQMKDYRWGIFLSEHDPDRRIGFGEHQGEPAWQQVPGEYRADLRRLIVIQGDTEPASGRAAAQPRRHRAQPVRPAQPLPGQRRGGQAPVGHGLPAARLLRPRRPGGGRATAAPQLRQSDSPRILGAFNEETPDWLSFFMFTYFTDRDGKYQLGTLKESAFDPLSRTAEFMLRKRRTTCSSAPPAWTGWSSGPRSSWWSRTPTT